MADIENEAQRADREQPDICRRRQRAAAHRLEAESKAGQPDPDQSEAGQVEGPPGRVAHVLDEQIDQQDAERADRNVQEKDPAPRAVGHDQAAERRANHRADQCRHADIGHRPHQLGFRHGAQQHEPADRHHHRPAHALHDAGEDQHRQRIGETAADRPQGEDDNRGAEHAARAKAVGGPAADRDEDREAQEVTSDRDVEPERVLAERGAHYRQGGGDDRRIEALHEHRAGDDQRDQ